SRPHGPHSAPYGICYTLSCRAHCATNSRIGQTGFIAYRGLECAQAGPEQASSGNGISAGDSKCRRGGDHIRSYVPEQPAAGMHEGRIPLARTGYIGVQSGAAVLRSEAHVIADITHAPAEVGESLAGAGQKVATKAPRRVQHWI